MEQGGRQRRKRRAASTKELSNADLQRQAILDNIPDQAWLKDAESRYIAVNQAYAEACGVPEQEILARRPPDVWPDAVAAQYLKTDGAVLGSGQSRRYEEKRRDRLGRLRTFETIKTPVRGTDGAIIGTVGISRDITHYKDVEKELREQRARARELSAHLQSIREQERKRISRELHDELGQNLSALGLGLDWIAAKLPSLSCEIAEKLASLRHLTGATLDAMERIATELRPAVLDDLGLAAAVEYLVNSTLVEVGIAVALRVDLGAAPIDSNVSTVVFRILQEGLTNVIRHADAHEVSVSLRRDTTAITLEVIDDGRGLPRHKSFGDVAGLGLLGMEERARMVGAALTIGNAPHTGTRLVLRVPLENAPEEAP